MSKIKLSYRMLRNVVLSVALSLIMFNVGYQTAVKRGVVGEQSNLVKGFLNPVDKDQVRGADFTKFWELWRRLEKSYVDTSKLDYQKMTWGAMEGLASSLGDPYTTYLPPDDNKRINEDLSGSFYGVGIMLGYIKDNLAVIAPLKDSPAEKAGVKAGDLIVHIKDESKGVDEDTGGMSLEDAVEKIRGELRVPVTLTLYREGKKELFDVEIVRDEIVVPSVEVSYETRNGKTYAYLQLHTFGGRTEREWLKAVKEIKSKDVAGVVLDLRNNPGGYLDGAVFIAGEFLGMGEEVVKQEGRSDNEVFRVMRKGSLLKIPLVVLINGGSASASEIVTGALKDHQRAKVVGEKSFGKGTVQEIQTLDDGSSLHVTVAKWILPSGKWIDKEGIEPDVEVKDDIETVDVDEALEKAFKAF